VCERLELLAVGVPVEARSRAVGVVEGRGARPIQCARCGDTDERAVQRSSCECVVHDAILPRSEQQRQRRRPLSEVGARDLARLRCLARAVEDVVGDLERDAERGPELTQPEIAAAAAEQTCCLEQLPGLERAPLEVALDGRVRVVRLAALKGFSACETQRRVAKR
jgi:hypothetical protein